MAVRVGNVKEMAAPANRPSYPPLRRLGRRIAHTAL